jgi:hypothetical protein
MKRCSQTSSRSLWFLFKRVPYQHGMVRPRFASGECLHICRVAMDVFSKQSRMSNKGCYPACLLFSCTFTINMIIISNIIHRHTFFSNTTFWKLSIFSLIFNRTGNFQLSWALWYSYSRSLDQNCQNTFRLFLKCLCYKNFTRPGNWINCLGIIQATFEGHMKWSKRKLEDKSKVNIV